MAHDDRIGLATEPSGETIIPSFADGQQWVRAGVAGRAGLAALLGGEGIHRGFDVAADQVLASAAAPLVLAIDDGSAVWWFDFAADQTITFHTTSGTLNLYAVIDLVAGASPDMAAGGRAACSFETAASPPAYSLLLGSGTVVDSAFTDFTEDADARVQPLVADPATMGNADGEIAALTFSATPTQAEVEALRDKCEELADDARETRAQLVAVIDGLRERGIIGDTA